MRTTPTRGEYRTLIDISSSHYTNTHEHRLPAWQLACRRHAQIGLLLNHRFSWGAAAWAVAERDTSKQRPIIACAAAIRGLSTTAFHLAQLISRHLAFRPFAPDALHCSSKIATEVAVKTTLQHWPPPPRERVACRKKHLRAAIEQRALDRVQDAALACFTLRLGVTAELVGGLARTAAEESRP